VDDVYYWAIGKVGVDEESASVLKSQNVNGKALWTYTYDKLKQIVPNFAEQLSNVINKMVTFQHFFGQWVKEGPQLIEWLNKVVRLPEGTTELPSELKLQSGPNLFNLSYFVF
jgi:hypothetical protein